MTYTEAVNALRAHLDASTTLPCYWPNSPTNPADDTAAQTGWVFSEAFLQDERPVSLGPSGSRAHRDYGEFAIYVYVPLGSKIGTAETTVEGIRAAFGMTTIPGLVIDKKTIQRGEEVTGPNGRWYAVPLILEWWTDRVE